MTELPEFKLIVAGGRDFNDRDLLTTWIDSLANGTLQTKAVSIVSGMARGADALGAEFARLHNVKLYEFPALWNTHGKSAGFIRNQLMLDFSDGLLAFWDGKSVGTADMLYRTRKAAKPVWVVRY